MERESSELSESPPEHWSISYRFRDIRAESCRTFGTGHFGPFKKVQIGGTFSRAPEAPLGLCS